MNSDEKKIEELRAKIQAWSNYYYNQDKSIVSDEQYDAAYHELVALEKMNPHLISKDSPTQKVGGTIDNRFSKVNHVFPMLSLGNAFNSTELLHFDRQIKTQLQIERDIEYIFEYKIDGLSISLEYEKGKLIRALTRGDGITGEDVTHNVLQIEDIPKIIPYKDSRIEFRGEIYMPKSVLLRLNQEGLSLANPRNAAAGTIRQLNSEITKKRNLASFIYSIPNPLFYGLETHEEVISFIKSNGFMVNNFTKKISSLNQFQEHIDYLDYNRKTQDYEIDGIVVKVNDISLYEDIGYTSKFPKFMIAYKFSAEVGRTELLEIFPTIGRTGRVTYNAKLSPVKLAGTTVTAATLHNASYIESLELNVGDIVSIKKAGEIIPKVIGVSEKNNFQKWIPSQFCPYCGTELIRFEGEVDQYCTNINCPQIKQAMFEHFVSRLAMNIEGVSSEIIRLFIKEGFLTDFASIFELEKHSNEILNLPGFKEKSVHNLIESINKAEKQPLNKFIFSLGIRHIGEKGAKVLANRFGSLDNILGASREELMSIRDFGEKASDSLLNYFSKAETLELFERFKNVGLKIEEESKTYSNNFMNKTFVITGSLSRNRQYYVSEIETRGGNVSNTISKNTSYLLAGEKAGSKLEKATKLQVNIINEDDFKILLGEGKDE